jgi:hypothetical protein
MTKFQEPAWVGMDVDAELARYKREDRRHKRAQRVLAVRVSFGRALRAFLSLVGKEASAPQSPQTA